MTSSSGSPRVLVSTSLGDIEVDVFPDKAPITSENFLRYVEDKLYDGTAFFRTVTMENQPDSDVKIEVIQGGTTPCWTPPTPAAYPWSRWTAPSTSSRR